MPLFLRTLFVGLLALRTSALIAQPGPAQCGTLPPDPTTYQQMVVRLRTSPSARMGIGSSVNIPVVYTFIRPTSSQGQPLSKNQYDDMNQSFYWLNRYHRESNLNYYIASVNIIDEDALNNRLWDPSDGFNYTFPLRLPKDALNIVVTPTMTNAAGYAYYPNRYAGQSTNVVYVSAYWLGRQMNLLPHEVGHYFNLMHTFDYGGTGKELVNGSNCSTAGDLVCDTPADPYDVNNPGTLNNGCQYIGTVRDANGELYRPDMTNMMSYWHASGWGCSTDHLTTGQFNRLYDGYRFRLENLGTGEQQYSLSAPEATIEIPQLSLSRSGTAAMLSARLVTGTTGLIIERSESPDGPWNVLAGIYAQTYYDTPDLSRTWHYRVRNSNSTQYSNVATLSPLKAQTIAFSSIPSKTFGDEPVTLSATSSADLPITFQVSSGPGQIQNNNQLFITGAGAIHVQAVQKGNTEYAATVAYQVLNVAKAHQTVTVVPVPDKTYGDDPILLSATATTGLPVQFQVTEGPGSVAGDQLSIRGAGVITLQAYQPGNQNYSSASAPFFIKVAKANQSLQFYAIGDKTYGDTAFYVSAVATSRLGITYQAKGPASVAGNRVEITGAGTVTLTAQQPGNENYNPAEDVIQTFRIAKAAQQLQVVPVPDKTYGDAAFQLPTTSTSGLSPSVQVMTGPARFSDGLVHLTGAGTVTVRIGQPGNDNYVSAKDTTQTFTVAKGSQTITFNSLNPVTYGDASVSLGARTSSGLPITYQILSGPATLDADRLLIGGAGQVVIKATQPGDANYLPATDASQTLVIQKRQQVIRFDTLTDRPYSPALLDLKLVSNSTLPIKLNATGPVEVTPDNQIRMLRAGTVTITATQPGDTNNLAAETVTRSFVIQKTAQQLDTMPDAIQLATATYPLTLTASSGLPVTYELLNGPATLQNNTLTFRDFGRISLRINQPGDDRYHEVQPQTYEICVNPMKPQITSDPASPFLLVSSSPFRNQWFRNGDTLRGATTPTLAVTLAGEYTVRVTNPDPQCANTQQSDSRQIVILAVDEPVVNQLSIWPNPATDQVQVRVAHGRPGSLATADLLTLTGQVVLAPVALVRSANALEATLSLEHIPAGIYLVRVRIGDQTLVQRLLIR
ncbi:hypothetical protein GCM10027341_07000 [Spirosoma knui]